VHKTVCAERTDQRGEGRKLTMYDVDEDRPQLSPQARLLYAVVLLLICYALYRLI
jgi:hypothetical protein